MTALLHLLVRQNNESNPIPVPVPVPAHGTNGVRHGKPVIAFIIGLSIVTLASVLNAAGLNLTKLDHVRAAPRQTSRATLTDLYVLTGPNQSHPEKRAEERLVTPVMAPWNVTVHVWFLTFLVHDPGLCLRLSQLIGSTLALEYMRAGTPFSWR
jgi:hypothetical protein